MRRIKIAWLVIKLVFVWSVLFVASVLWLTGCTTAQQQVAKQNAKRALYCAGRELPAYLYAVKRCVWEAEGQKGEARPKGGEGKRSAPGVRPAPR